jgi:protein-S-isoprenylcysteine O-methyltransferase Ste14
MSRQTATIGTIVFFFAAPGTVAGLLPYAITRWRLPPMPPPYLAVRIAGGLLIVGGLALIVENFARFALEGRGTPAPPRPTETLVVRGAYRYTRNPMYVAVLSIILGQVLFFASLPLLIYAGAVALAFHLFVLFYEEPTLARTYGEEYERYCAAVPRWIPRFPSQPPRN